MNLSIATFNAIPPAQAGVVGAGEIRPRTTSWTWRAIANAASVCAAASVLVVAATLLVDSRQSTASARAAIPEGAVVQAPLTSDAPTQEEAAGNPSQESVLPVPGGDVIERRGADIVIDLNRQSRLQAAQQLAALTGARLMDGSALLERAMPVTLQWRGRDPLQAWRRLLGENIRHVVHCQADGCRVWVLALNATVTSTSPVEGVAGDKPGDVRQSAPAALSVPEPAEEVQVAPMNTPTPPDE